MAFFARIAALAALLAASPAFAQKTMTCIVGPNTAIEKRVCADATVALRDAQLNGLYGIAQHFVGDRKRLLAEQRAWLANERDVCKDASCLTSAYEKRIATLRKTIDAAAQPLPAKLQAKRVERGETSSACKQFKTPSFFEVTLQTEAAAAKGAIDGLYDCGRKAWGGGIALDGRVEGKIATVRFDGGFNRQKTMAAFVAWNGRDVFWQVYLFPEDDEYYMPPATRLPVIR